MLQATTTPEPSMPALAVVAGGTLQTPDYLSTPTETTYAFLAPPGARWTPQEDQYLRSSAGRIPYPEIAAKLHRSVSAIRAYMQYHSIEPHHPPTAKQKLVALISTAQEKLPPSHYAQAVKVTVPYVYEICHAMKTAGIDLFSKLECRWVGRKAVGA